MFFTCSLFVGDQRPSLKYLNRYVRSSVGLKWHDLGIELLDQDDLVELNNIRAQYSLDVNECCKEMFQLWLRKQLNASWNQLIEALRQPGIELDTLASKIEQMLHKAGWCKPSFLILLIAIQICKYSFICHYLKITAGLGNYISINV